MPERVGDAQWMLRGTINGDSIDQMFNTADGKFDAIQPPATADAAATTMGGTDMPRTDMSDMAGQ